MEILLRMYYHSQTKSTLKYVWLKGDEGMEEAERNYFKLKLFGCIIKRKLGRGIKFRQKSILAFPQNEGS
jgi:hypothetical protein